MAYIHMWSNVSQTFTWKTANALNVFYNMLQIIKI